MLVPQAVATARDYRAQYLRGFAKPAQRRQRGGQTMAGPQRAGVRSSKSRFLCGTHRAKLAFAILKAFGGELQRAGNGWSAFSDALGLGPDFLPEA